MATQRSKSLGKKAKAAELSKLGKKLKAAGIPSNFATALDELFVNLKHEKVKWPQAKRLFESYFTTSKMDLGSIKRAREILSESYKE